MARITHSLSSRIAERIEPSVDPAIARFAGAEAVLFYGSNLRTGSLDGVLDFYVLLPGKERARIWPEVSYREREEAGGTKLRAKIATMALSTFAAAALSSLAISLRLT